MRTIGVAVTVPEPWGPQLRDYRVRLGDPEAARIPTHITLLPPIDVEESLLPGIVEHLQAAAAEVTPFTVHLHGTGSFRPVSPVVFVNVVKGGGPCGRLAAAVRTWPLAVDLPFPYHPHVTVAHHLDDALLDRACDELEDFTCRFEVDDIALYVHDRQGWTPHRSLPLGTSWLPSPEHSGADRSAP